MRFTSTHLIGPEVSLDPHIEDMLAVLEYGDLQDVVPVGHGHGAMVATGVTERAAALRRRRYTWTRLRRVTARARSTCLFPAAGRVHNEAQARDQGRAGWCRRTRGRLFAERTRADAAWRLWSSTPATTPHHDGTDAGRVAASHRLQTARELALLIFRRNRWTFFSSRLTEAEPIFLS